MTGTLAPVIQHPTLKRKLRIDALREEIADAESLAEGLESGRISWDKWFDGPGFYGAQETAALEAWQFAQQLRKQLAELEAGGAA